MNIINIALGVDTQLCSSITLGRRGENEVTQVVVDFSSWVEEFGAGVITLLAMRSQDTSAYPVVLTLDGNTATWDVTSTDTAYKGSGRAEYIYTVGDQIAKSVVFNTVVMQDIGEPSETPPDPYEDWLERLTELGAETQANAEAAQQSAENAAESAEDAAQSATSAEGYAGQAETAAGLAQAAQTASEAARDDAQTAQTSAEVSATAASASAASAASSATAAVGSASDASSSASSAGASATTASTAAGQAEAAQSAAEDAQAAAEQAAQQAHVEYEQLSGEVDDLSDEVSQQKSAIEALEDLTNRKAGMLVDTASGAIASFVPDATVPNLLGVTVDIEPVQDLHGYDNPWPGGGGKNKFGCADGSYAIGSTRTAIVTNGVWSYKVNSAATSSVFLPEATVTAMNIPALKAGTYMFSLVSNAAASSVIASAVLNLSDGQAITNGNSFTISADTSIISITTSISGQYAVGTYTCQIQIESGTSGTSWTPYENICPISGFDSVEVEADGVNIYPPTQKIENAYISTSGEVVLQNLYTVYYCAIKKGVTYTYSMDTGTPIYAFYSVLPEYGVISYNGTRYVGTAGAVNVTFTAPIDGYIAFRIASTFTTPMVVVGSIAPANYVPYAGNRYTIQLGQTIYGAKLTIAEDGSVNAKVDRAKVDMGTLNWAAYSAGVNTYRAQIAEKALGDLNLICSAYKTEASAFANMTNGTIRGTTGNAYVYVRDNNYTDVTSFKTAVTGQAIVYELATPVEIQLDPVTISTISGQTNNVWADAGDVDVTYAADIKAYIDRLNQPTEDDMIANSLIAANKYFTVNNRLFLSTASIAAGAMIIPGTNCTETSLAAALNALNA